jgi:hypothetical protein
MDDEGDEERTPTAEIDESALVEAADRLLYEAKAGVPNRTCARMAVVGAAEAEARKDRTTEV